MKYFSRIQNVFWIQGTLYRLLEYHSLFTHLPGKKGFFHRSYAVFARKCSTEFNCIVEYLFNSLFHPLHFFRVTHIRVDSRMQVAFPCMTDDYTIQIILLFTLVAL